LDSIHVETAVGTWRFLVKRASLRGGGCFGAGGQDSCSRPPSGRHTVLCLPAFDEPYSHGRVHRHTRLPVSRVWLNDPLSQWCGRCSRGTADDVGVAPSASGSVGLGVVAHCVSFRRTAAPSLLNTLQGLVPRTLLSGASRPSSSRASAWTPLAFAKTAPALVRSRVAGASPQHRRSSCVSRPRCVSSRRPLPRPR
jgi:hypothetical protein